jgi:hypothetical protein
LVEGELDGAFFGAAVPAPVAGALVGAAVAVEVFAAGGTLGGPAAGGHDGEAFVATFGFAADDGAHAFPGGAVSGFFAGKGVGDFVEDGFADLGFVVGEDEVEGEFDAALAVAAEAEGALAAVPGEVPALSGEVRGDEGFGELTGGGGEHEGVIKCKTQNSKCENQFDEAVRVGSAFF